MTCTRGIVRGVTVVGIALMAASAQAQTIPPWQPVTTELIQREKPGYGKLCGVAVEPRSGDVYVNLSDKGIYRSTDQGKSWTRLEEPPVKGRTEWPGCLMLDPLGKGRIVVARVYGAPITVSLDGGKSWKAMHAKSSHVDWCAVDWSDPDMKFLFALKHEAGDLLIVSRDGGKSFGDVAKGYGPAWIFDAKTAVVAQAKSKTNPQPGLVRTVDAGKTFERCADYSTRALPRWHEDKLYWLVDGAIITTADTGQSWQKLCGVKDGRFGPVFGKNPEHLLVLSGAGIIETMDAGKSWSPALRLPVELKGASPLTWLTYDANSDALYVMKMGSELYKWDRRAK